MQRPESDYALLNSCIDAFLAECYELRLYALQLESAPNAFSGLGAPGLSKTTKESLESRLLREWEVVLQMEATKESAQVLKMLCPHTQRQCYRELCIALELCRNPGERWHQDLQSLISAYFPDVGNSANVEQIFAQLQDAVNRSCKPDVGSMSNLMAVCVRAMQNRVCNQSDCTPVTLATQDWEGKATRALKPKIWSPAFASPSNPPCFKS